MRVSNISKNQERSYTYFIVYKGYQDGKPILEANTEMFCNKQIDSIDDIRFLEKFLLKNTSPDAFIDSVLITWYSLLKSV